MRRVPYLLVLVWLALGVLSPRTYAQAPIPWNEDRLTWVLATTCQDGSPASACPLTGIRVETATAAAGPWSALATVAGTATSYTRTNTPLGTNWYRLVVLSAEGNAISASVSVVTRAPLPNPPVLTVAEVVAGINMAPLYRINADGTRGTVVLGFMPTGKACAGPVVYRYRGADYRRPADLSAAKWWGSSPTPNVAAPCA